MVLGLFIEDVASLPFTVGQIGNQPAVNVGLRLSVLRE